MTERQEVVMTACMPECSHFWDREETAHDKCPEYLGDRYHCACHCHKKSKKVIRRKSKA